MKSRKVLLGLFVGLCACLAGSASAQTANYQSDKFVEIGPDNVAGRTTSIAVTYPAGSWMPILYAGAANGGLYTKTYGETYWNYKPCYINGEEVTLPVSYLLNGKDDTVIYVATGEAQYAHGSRKSAMGSLGRGIFRYSTATEAFTLIPNTDPAGNSNSDFAAVTRLGSMINGSTTYFFAATSTGLFRWTINSPADWATAPTKLFSGRIDDLEVVSARNMVFFTSEGKIFKIGNAMTGTSCVNITSSCSDFETNVSVIELAVAPSDPTYMYAMVCDTLGKMKAVYQTRNQNSWIVLSTSTVNPFTYTPATTCGALAVSPTDPATIYIGGSEIWSGKGYVEGASFQWTSSSVSENVLNFGDYMSTVYSNQTYVHSGIHQIVPFLIAGNYQMNLIATDGGVFCGHGEMNYFTYESRGMNTLQVNSVAVTPDGSIISGAHANACPFIESRMAHSGGSFDSTWYDASNGTNTNHQANILWHGNGGAVAASSFSQYAPYSRRNIFVSSASGSIGRAYADYNNYTNTQTWTADMDFMTNLVAGGPAIGQIHLWETDHNTTIKDSINFTIDTMAYIHRNGETFRLSKNFEVKANDSIVVLDKAHAYYPFYHVFDHDFTVGQEMNHRIMTPHISRMLAVTIAKDLPKTTCVSYTWVPNDFTRVFDEGTAGNDDYKGIFWGHIYAVDGEINPGFVARTAVLSKDGDCAIIAVEDTKENKSFLARVHGLNSIDYTIKMRDIRDAVNYQIRTRVTTTDTIIVTPADSNYYFGRRISSIAVDPREGQDRVVITFDGYSATEPNIAIIDNVSGEYTITYANIADSTPAYSAMIECTTGALFVGTGEGLYKSDSLTAPSFEKYGAFKGVPVTALYQQTSNRPLIHYTGHEGIDEVPYIFPKTKWPYAIYIGTYGRGIFMDSTYVEDHENEIVSPSDYNPNSIPTVTSNGDNSVRFYPNPAVTSATMELNIANAGNATMRIYDLSGKIVMTENLGKLAAGQHTSTIDCSKLRTGMYLVNVTVGNQKAAAKLIVR